VTGPIDVVAHGVTGVLDEDLAKAARAALELDRDACRRAAGEWTWERASAQFFGHLVRARDGSDLAACADGAAAGPTALQALEPRTAAVLPRPKLGSA
jgi:hypothetical protein